MTDERRLRTRDELLAQVRRDGTGRRRRFIAITSGSVLVVIAVIALVVTDSSSPPRDRVTANDPNPTTSTSTTVAEPVPTTSATTTADSPAVATTALACRNSSNPACGPLVWDPPVVNKPGTITATQLPRRPGDDPGLVLLQVTYSDPDSGGAWCTWAFDNVNADPLDAIMRTQNCRIHAVGYCPGSYGPWDSPPPRPITQTLVLAVHNETAGSHTVEVGALLSSNMALSKDAGSAPCDPYTETMTNTIHIVVSAADGAVSSSTSTTTAPTPTIS
jgi:hypothetical protein